MTLLSQALLEEGGWSRHDHAGFRSIFGVSISDDQFIRLNARCVLYEQGVLGADEDAQAMMILVLEDVSVMRISSMTEDLFDLAKRSRNRIAAQPRCEHCLTAMDLGAAEGGGEAYLLASQLREEMRDVMALRIVSDADLPRPAFDGPHQSYRMSPEALVGSLAARASARQVLIRDEASIGSRRVLTDALRQAGNTNPRMMGGLVRLIAWAAEIAMRPLVRPIADMEAGAHLRPEEAKSGPIVVTPR